MIPHTHTHLIQQPFAKLSGCQSYCWHTHTYFYLCFPLYFPTPLFGVLVLLPSWFSPLDSPDTPIMQSIVLLAMQVFKHREWGCQSGVMHGYTWRHPSCPQYQERCLCLCRLFVLASSPCHRVYFLDHARDRQTGQAGKVGKIGMMVGKGIQRR